MQCDAAPAHQRPLCHTSSRPALTFVLLPDTRRTLTATISEGSAQQLGCKACSGGTLEAALKDGAEAEVDVHSTGQCLCSTVCGPKQCPPAGCGFCGVSLQLTPTSSLCVQSLMPLQRRTSPRGDENTKQCQPCRPPRAHKSVAARPALRSAAAQLLRLVTPREHCARQLRGHVTNCMQRHNRLCLLRCPWRCLSCRAPPRLLRHTAAPQCFALTSR